MNKLTATKPPAAMNVLITLNATAPSIVLLNAIMQSNEKENETVYVLVCFDEPVPRPSSSSRSSERTGMRGSKSSFVRDMANPSVYVYNMSALDAGQATQDGRGRIL